MNERKKERKEEGEHTSTSGFLALQEASHNGAAFQAHRTVLLAAVRASIVKLRARSSTCTKATQTMPRCCRTTASA